MIRNLLGPSVTECDSLCQLKVSLIEASQLWKCCLVETLAGIGAGCSQVLKKCPHDMCITVMDLLLLSRASEASFQAERKNVVLPPLPAMTAAQGAPNSTRRSQKRPRTESDGLELPAVDNPARNQDPQKPGVLCDSLQKHPLR